MRLRASLLCAPSVRMLCRRSASLIMITRKSRDIASSILRKLSAAASWRSRNLSLSSLVTPSTRLGHRLAEFRRQLFAGQRGVFDGVMQDRGDQRFHVQAEPRRARRRPQPDG